MIELKGGQAMWYMIDYENVHEEGLYGIETVSYTHLDVYKRQVLHVVFSPPEYAFAAAVRKK